MSITPPGEVAMRKIGEFRGDGGWKAGGGRWEMGGGRWEMESGRQTMNGNAVPS
jgi:hypothetical protein